MVLQQNETFAVASEEEKEKMSESSATFSLQSTDKDFSVSLPSTATPLKDSIESKNIDLTKLNLQLISPDELTRTRSSKFKLNKFLGDKSIMSNRNKSPKSPFE